jgi:flagellar biosynthesis/type III secretory pathway chaperone
MVLNQLSDAVMAQLHSLLEQMDVCAQELEAITQQEYEAIRTLDAEQIMQSGKQRLITHEYLVQLEQQSRQLLSQYQVPEQLPLSSVIDLYFDDQSTELQALRKNLYERILKVDQKTQENRMRLHAAYSVSTSILQSLGLSQQQQTYNRGSAG